MGDLSVGEKALRGMRLLLGIRHRKVAAALAQFGFSQSSLDEGWELLRALAGDRLDTRWAAADPKVIDAIDDFENLWFPVVSATLQHRHPSVHERLFHNLSQTRGAEVLISVPTFLERIRGLDVVDGRPDPDGAAAKELIEQRGLTAQKMDQVLSLVREVQTIQEGPAEDLADTVAQREEAEARFWAWYLEWSAIARIAVTDKRLLRIMGFRQGSTAKKGEPEANQPSEETPQ